MTTLAPAQLQQQFEGSRLAAAAYAAADIKTLLSTNPSTHQLSAGLHNALLKQGFNIEQANNFVQKYSPVAALDQDGAGAVLFRVNGTDQVAIAVRGTDTKTFENIRNDLVFADATITQGQLPVYQTTLIANFVLRETTPAGQPVPQFAVQGGNSNAADLLRASSDSATTNQLMTAGGGLNTSMLSSPQITLPTIIQTGTTLGTGRAVGPCVDAAGHSEGSPEVTVVGAAIAQCTRITTVNGPGVSLVQMQHVANEITSKANLPAQDLASQNQINSQLNVGTAGMSVIDGLNGGLPGTNTTLGIPTSYGGLVGSHSSIVAMNAAEAAYRDAGGVLNPGSANLSDTYNFPDTAGAGRGVVNPDAGTPNTPDKPSVFNASTALPNYSGDNAITIQPGDTVSSIAKRFDMTVDEFSGFLKGQYGEGADLNSIVAGSKLPLPPAVYERTLGGVNGLDLPADTAPGSTGATTTPETPDFQDALLDAFTNADQAAADIKAQYPESVQVADAGGGFFPANTNTAGSTFSNFLGTQGNALSSAQQTALATQLDALGLGGEADLSFYSLPSGGALIANADGDIVGEINLNSATGGLNLRATGIDADGNSVEVSQHISESGQSLTDAQYSQQQLGQLSAGLGLVNNFQSLQNWDDLNDLSRLSTLVGTYNNLSNLTSGASGFLGDLGPLAGGLGFIAALDSGDGLGIVSSVNVLSNHAIDGAINSALGSSGIPYLSVITSLANFEDNPAQSIGSLVGMYFGGPIGAAIGGFIGGMLGGLFGDDDMPMREGLAHAQWDANGHTQVLTTEDAEGGGATASNWMSSLVKGLQTNLDQTVDANGQAQYGLVPGLLPSVGFKYDPDGFNLANGAKGFMYLQWTDANGQTQTRYYDGAGDRGDGSGQTLAGDFMQHAQGAIAPAWQVQTVWAHYQQGGPLELPEQSSSLPTELADGLQQTLQFVTLDLTHTLPTETSANGKFIDVDGDGYAEQTQWLQSNQAVLAVDLNGDGQISVGERVNLQDAAQVQQARTSMGWLDANGDGKLTAQDPAFAALKLWIDVNQDGQSQNGEVQSIGQAGITAIDFRTQPPSIERADGSHQALTVQTLTADTLGVAAQSTEGGVVQTTEQQDGTGSSVLHAVNTREFDGQAAHTQGGDLDIDGSSGQVVQVDASRLATTTNNTIASSSMQTSTAVGVGDSRLKSAGVMAAPAATGGSTVTAPGSNANNARVVFVPAGQSSTQREMLTVTNSMIESAQSSLFGVNGASGSAGLSSIGGLGVLTAVSMGVTASAANAAERVQHPVVVSDARSSDMVGAPNGVGGGVGAIVPVSTGNAFTTTLTTPTSRVVNGASTGPDAGSYTQVNWGSTEQSSQSGSGDPVNAATATSADAVFVLATVITSTNGSFDRNPGVNAAGNGSTTTQPLTHITTNVSASASAIGALSLGYPQVQAETLPGTEDVVLRLTQSVLLANDSTPNASADPTAPALTITAVSQPLHGQVSLVNGEVLFAPDINFHGTASFTYTVTDQYGLSTNGTATLLIAAVNDAPTTQGETAQTDEDTAIVFTQAELLANDHDVDVATDVQVLRISAVGGASHGSVSLLANGDVRFVPAANYHGPAEFTYTVSDGRVAEGAGASVDAKVVLTIAAVNDPSVAVGDLFTTSEDAITVFLPQDLLHNDTDNDIATDADVLSITRVFAPQHCTVTLNSDGTISLTPDRNYHGSVRFSYEITDTQGATSTAFVVAGVDAVNDVPVGNEDRFDSLEDDIVTLNQADLLDNDTDDDIATDGDVLHVASVRNATHGEVRLLPNGKIEFVPESNFHGVATFDYVVSDSFGATSLSTVRLNVGAVNDVPVVVNETKATIEDILYTTTDVALLANDSDVDMATDGQVLSVLQVQNAQHGVVAMDANGRITFTPDADFHGTASFEYVVSDGVGAGAGGLRTGTVTLNVQAVNDAPVTQGESWKSNEDEALLFLATQLLANDSDVDVATDNQVLSINRVACDPAKGRAWLDAQGNVRFVPTPEYHGAVTLTYWVSDGAAADGAGAETPATISLTITAVNDIPVVQGEATATTEDTALSIDAAILLANDMDVDVVTDGQVLSISAVSNAAHCTVSLVTQADGTQRITFVPDTNFHGSATFDYTVSDGNGGTAVATAVVNLSAVNDAPVTTGESATGDEDNTLVFTSRDLLINDTDVDVATDSQVLSISRVGGATHGTVTLDALGQVHFTPDANYHGPAQFTYWVSDGLAGNGAGAETPATVSLTILAVNDLPMTTGEAVNANEDTTLLFNSATLLANDTDVDTATDGQVLVITNIGSAQHGSVAWAMQSDGSQYIAFTPERNYFGMASYQYTVSDGNGGTATTTVAINLAAVNDAPDVVDDTFSATEDTPLTWTQASLLVNDSDLDNLHTDLRIVGVSNATHGTVNLNADGSISFNPELDYFGPATFNYTVSDGAGGFSVGTATVNMAPVNDNPWAVGEYLSLNEDERTTLSVASLLANDSDVDNPHAQLNIQSVGNATHGSVSLVTINGSTSVVFTPELNFNGAASFTYTVSDGVGGTATTSMTLNFTSVNDVPVVNNELFNGKRNVSYSLSTAALLANDTDVETPGGLNVVSVGNARYGSVSLTNGNVVFVPDAGYAGRGSFDYVVQDANGGQSSATAQIDFSHVNANPIAVNDSFAGFEDVPFSITQAQLLVNDSDSDNASTSLRVTNLGSATHGSVAFDAQGNVVFTPTANFYGQASFTYQVTDPDGGSTWATASLSVASVNDAPIIEDVWYGRPLYGYKWQANVSTDEYGSYAGHSWGLVAVTSESEARSLVSNSGDVVYAAGLPAWAGDRSRSNDLMTATGVVLPPNYYQNGQQKPIAFDALDATAQTESGSSYVLTSVDDGYRQNGSIIAYDPDGNSSALTFSIGSTPQHGHAWANQYTSLNAPESIDHTQADSYWVNQTGAWQYYSTRGDTYSGADGFQVFVTDSAGASTSITVNATHKGSSPEGGGGKKPVTLDLNGDGLQYIGLDDSKAYFDVNDDGWRERMAWVGAGDGLLALDTQGDRTIDKWNEISFVSYKEDAQTDLEGLQAFDSSGNGKLDRLDARWNEFGAWVDANANGVCETGEFISLDDLRIVSIDLTSDQHVVTPVLGVTELGQSKFTTVDGKTHAVGDVVFAVDAHDRLTSGAPDGLALQRPEPGQDAAPQKTDADSQLAEGIRQAMLFNQMVNTAIVPNEPPLSFVASELLSQDWGHIELQSSVDPFSVPKVSAL